METKSVAYKCPACGAPLEFEALTQHFTCHFCGSAFDKRTLDQHFTEDEFTERESFADEEKNLIKRRNQEWRDQNILYNCPSCGAGIFTDHENTVSVRCHYCNSPVVLAGKLSGEFRPDKLIPFSTTREFAEESFKKWSGKRFFVPKEFKSERTLAEMKGIYVPFWLADCRVEGELEAIGQDSARSVNGNPTRITVKEYLVERKGSMICRGVPVDGSARAADLLMENIEPFDYTKLIDFDMSYLSGHNAEKYDVPKEMVYSRIEQRVCEEALSVFKSSAKQYSPLNITRSVFKVTGVNWTYALLPVWFLSYYYKNKLYCYAMNGQTGKFSGRLPFNKIKFGLCAACFAAGISIIILMFFVLGWYR